MEVTEGISTNSKKSYSLHVCVYFSFYLFIYIFFWLLLWGGGQSSIIVYLTFLFHQYAHPKQEAKLSPRLHLSNFSKLNLVEMNCTHIIQHKFNNVQVEMSYARFSMRPYFCKCASQQSCCQSEHLSTGLGMPTSSCIVIEQVSCIFTKVSGHRFLHNFFHAVLKLSCLK